ncbi:MAG: phosphatidylserine decarboxylase [Candidatus Acidiferrales bacterium]
MAGALTLALGWRIAGVVLLALAGFILFFFRDPERAIPAEPGVVVSPADGRVLGVEDTTLEGRAVTRVSIFLSIFDVHVNRAPIAGRVTAVRYQRGRFHVAARAAASEENELNEVALEGEGTRVVFRQIAGLIARRIEFWSRMGEELTRGQRLGLIRFGSRVEVFFEPTYRAQVSAGARVHGGSSVLAVRQ